MKWISKIDGNEYDTIEEVRDCVAEDLDFYDVLGQVGCRYTLCEIIKELARLDSPMFWDMYEDTIDEQIKDWFYEDDEDEDE